MNQYVLSVAVCLSMGAVHAEVHAEVLTGVINQGAGGISLVGTPLGLEFQGWSHDEVDYADLIWNNPSYAVGASFVGASWSDYSIGDSVTATDNRYSGLAWGSSFYDPFYDEISYSYIGVIGETFFLGFTFVNDSDPGNILQNFGFIQIEKLTPSQYNWVGYAYETDANASIEVFNLVPAPSGVAVFGLAALGVTRRRRV